MKNAIASVFNTAPCARSCAEFTEWKSNLTGASREVTRAMRKARRATEDFLDVVTLVIKRQPLKSAGIAFGVGAGAGALVGWFRTRR